MHVNDGVSYHRHIAPISNLDEWSFVHPRFDVEKEQQAHTKEQIHKLITENQCSILVTQRNDLPDYIAGCQVLQAGYKIPWVYDTDDNVHAVRPSNPGFQSYNASSYNPQW